MSYDDWKQQTPTTFGVFEEGIRCPLCLEKTELLTKIPQELAIEMDVNCDTMVCLKCKENE